MVKSGISAPKRIMSGHTFFKASEKSAAFLHNNILKPVFLSEAITGAMAEALLEATIAKAALLFIIKKSPEKG
jgi:hypothetical protein